MIDSPSSSSLSSEDDSVLTLIVHGGKLDREADVCIDARCRAAWPVLAALDVDLSNLPVVYELRVTREWLDRPVPLCRRRKRRVLEGQSKFHSIQ